jgi:hypothetical protein
MSGFDDQETKLPTYWSLPFKEICLGMKVNNELNFISISYQASSLFSLIADGSYRPTNLGRGKWFSLVKNSGLQRYCSREGFNVQRTDLRRYPNTFKTRIGIIGNNENECISPDSYLGFGGITAKISNTCGNRAYISGGNKKIRAMGYIFVR